MESSRDLLPLASRFFRRLSSPWKTLLQMEDEIVKR